MALQQELVGAAQPVLSGTVPAEARGSKTLIQLPGSVPSHPVRMTASTALPAPCPLFIVLHRSLTLTRALCSYNFPDVHEQELRWLFVEPLPTWLVFVVDSRVLPGRDMQARPSYLHVVLGAFGRPAK